MDGLFDRATVEQVKDAHAMRVPIKDAVAKSIANSLRLMLWRTGSVIPQALIEFDDDGSISSPQLSLALDIVEREARKLALDDDDARTVILMIDSLRGYLKYVAPLVADAPGRGPVAGWSELKVK